VFERHYTQLQSKHSETKAAQPPLEFRVSVAIRGQVEGRGQNEPQEGYIPAKKNPAWGLFSVNDED